MSGLRDESGEFTLIGLLVAMTLFLGVLAATLSLFATSETTNRDIQRRNDAMDRARSGMDLLSRQLRNMASPTPEQPQAIARAVGTDAIFQTIDATGGSSGNFRNVMRVRYCLDTATGTFWRQDQRWTTATGPSLPSDGGSATAAGSCPSAAWSTRTVVADHVTNYETGHARPIFTYQPVTTDLTAIRSVHTDLYLDLDVASAPLETSISSGVHLRNQNQRPIAAFTWVRSSQGVVLNASGSRDPEGEPLTYCWYQTGLTSLAAGSPNLPSPCDPGPLLATGVTFTDPIAAGQSRDVWLVVKDPALLGSSDPNSTPATTRITN